MNKLENPVVEKDIVQVFIEGNPAFFARVESFLPDSKPNWWHVKLLVLQVPLHVVTWILRHEQINGEEFTMGGIPIRIEKVITPSESDITPQLEKKKEKTAKDNSEPREAKPAQEKQARILSLGEKKEI
ncbi:MAG: hypothetical protein H6696_07155 [Deferribacteres bacterium]|nr:hypothetical protein [Deferribacteres bacterium]